MSLFRSMTAAWAVAALATVSFSTMAWGDEPEKVALFLTGGQSNTDGRLDGVSAGQQLPSYLVGGNSNALVCATSGNSTRVGTFLSYAPTSGKEGQPSKWAYDAVTYYYLGQALGSFYVAKTSYGGTSINPSVNNSPSGTHAWIDGYGSGYHWSADPTFLAATDIAGKDFTVEGATYEGQSLLLAWIQNIDAAIDALVAAGKEPEIKAILWHQGESDRTVSGSYKANLLQMIAYVRTHLVEKTGKAAYANLPFFCGTIPFASTQGSSTIDRTFLELDEDPSNHIYAVDIYDITLKSDNIHFSAEGAEIFGRRLYNRLVDAGIVAGEKVDESYAVRKPDFGLEHVVNNTTTWTFSEFKKGTVIAGTLVDYKGLYLHAENSTQRGFVSQSANQSLTFGIGDSSAVSITTAPYIVGRGNGKNVTAMTSAGNASSSYNTTAAVNVGRAGAFEAIVRANSDNAKYQLLFNGKVVDEMTNAVKGTTFSLKGTNTTAGVYYLSFDSYSYLFGARFVPEEEMAPVTVTIPEGGVTTFGNIAGVTFTVPDGVQAFTADIDASDATRVVFTEVTSINVGQTVILRGTSGAYTLEPAQGVAYTGDNLLVAQVTAGPVEAVAGEDFANYLVQGSGTSVTFTKSDETTVVPAGAGYLSVSTGSPQARQTTLRGTLPPRNLVFDVDADAIEDYGEAVSGEVSITKIGAGTLNFVGDNSFQGLVSIKTGTLKLDAPYAATGTLIAHFEGVELETNRFTTAGAITRPRHSFMVWNPNGVEKNYYVPMGDSGNANWCVRKRGASDTYWQVRNYNTWTRTTLVNGEDDTAKSGLQLLEETTGDWVRNSTGRLYFGSGTENTLHEIVLYANALTESQRIGMEHYLMAKWQIGNVSYTPLPTDASVTVATGATLDLGPYHPTLETVTLEKGARITAAQVEPGTILLTAQKIVDLGAKVQGATGEVHLAVVKNPDGTQSLKVLPGVRCFVIVLK